MPLDRLPDLETQVADVCAVMDAAGSRAGGHPRVRRRAARLPLLLAASRPERCRALVLLQHRGPDERRRRLPLGSARAGAARHRAIARLSRGLPATPSTSARIAPESRRRCRGFVEQLARLGRGAISPGAVAHYFRQSVLTDVRELLPLIQAPTLVLQRARNADRHAPELGRYLADHIPHARYVEIDGADHIWFTENADEVVDEIEEFLTGARTSADPDRRLATVLFTDIVGSTAHAAELGDTRLAGPARCARRRSCASSWHASVDARSIPRATASWRPSMGPVAPSAAPARSTMLWLPIGLAIRAGVHTGEVEVRGEQHRWARRAHRRPSGGDGRRR